jgi:nicotinamide-nucleotide adenylyltransferase
LRLAAKSARERFARTVVMLNDARLAAYLARTIHALASTPQPAGQILGEQDAFQSGGRVGLLAGSFNPLTRAHIALADAAKVVGRLDLMLWTLSVVTVDKERVQRASLVDRLLQMLAFTSNGPDMLGLINRGLYVEQVEVAQGLIQNLDELVVVVGFDKIVQILDPRYYDVDRDAVLDRLFASASLLVAPRADEDEAGLNALLSQAENRRYRERIAFCPLPRRYRRDSSSKARALASDPRNDRRLHAFLPPEGRALAQFTGAYRQETRSGGHGEPREDLYLMRQEIIEKLASLDPVQTVEIPGLDALIAMRKESE